MEEEVYHAELASPNRDSNILNGVAAATFAVTIVFLLVAVVFGDVVDKKMTEQDANVGVRVPVWERGSQNWSKHTHLDPKANRLHQEPQILKDLLDGKIIFRQKYNHDSGKFDQPKSLSAANFLIYEGLHPFFLKRQRDLFDLKIFLNPSKEINMLWKVNRDIKKIGKTREDVIEQINLRANDSESYIKSQIRYADIIIEPIEIKDAKRVGYNILFPNSFPIDEIIEKLSKEKNLRIEHNFLDEGNQSVIIIGEIQSEKLEYLAYEFIEGIQDLGISNPIWPNNEFGVLVFLVTYIIFEESEYGKN